MSVVIGVKQDCENFKKFTEFSNELFALMRKYGYKRIFPTTPEAFNSHHITVCGDSGKPEIVGMCFDSDGKGEGE